MTPATSASTAFKRAMLDGEAYLRAQDAARILTEAGVSPISAGGKLRTHVRRGDIQAYEVHPRAWLYREVDVRALADRYRTVAR